MRLSNFLFVGSHALESCLFEQGISLTCSLSGLSIEVTLEQPDSPCQLVIDNFNMYRVSVKEICERKNITLKIDVESDDGACRIWDGIGNVQPFSLAYDEKW